MTLLFSTVSSSSATHLDAPVMRRAGPTQDFPLGPGTQPWWASLRFRGSHFCGAAIVADHWLLTAAHCFSNSSEYGLLYHHYNL
ncbi:serine protease 27-like [Hoplias malabaricus]|uniref:serine protease 27-like n=1 Tax=Hoplias malabaricus TaxID=27720 RepID=UPI003462CF07